MPKTILITGSTDGIGLEAAKSLAAQGHAVILHGRSPDKISAARRAHPALAHSDSFQADFSNLSNVAQFARAVSESHDRIDVLINNAGVFKTANPITPDGLDIRFVVNTLAPYLLTLKLLPLMDNTARVINLSSAAQSPIDMNALLGNAALSASHAYAQSKLALTVWSREMAKARDKGPIMISVNPGSLLGTKMVKDAYGMDGKDISIGADILARLAVDPEFKNANGQYFDNDIGRFGPPHPDAMNEKKSKILMDTLSEIIAPYLKSE